MKRAVFALTFAAVLAAAAPGAPQAPAPAAAPAPGPGDFRPLDAANTLVIDTNRGRIIIELYPSIAPDSVARIETLARQHFYDGQTFFRVVDGFMAQTGDPKNTGQGGSSLPNVKGEFSFRHVPGAIAAVMPVSGGEIGFVGVMPVGSQTDAMAALTIDGKVRGFGVFCSGVIGMARTNENDSANSQFFIMRNEQFSLNQRYAAFGRVVSGEDVVRALKVGEPVPAPQDVMSKVQILADMPADSRPNLRVLDTSSAYFKGVMVRGFAAKGVNFNPCSIDIPVTAG